MKRLHMNARNLKQRRSRMANIIITME